MVNVSENALATPRWIALRMVAYAAAFLAFILWLVPYAFHRLGIFVGAQDAVRAWIESTAGPRTIFGGLIFVAGLSTYVVSSLWLVIVGKGPFVEFDPPREFVASGPYRWMRNPVAAALLITVLGEAVYVGSVGIAALVILGLPMAHLQVTRVEEPRLRQRFGESYERYCRDVPRWWPRRPRAATNLGGVGTR